jgi:hypothetical protein
MKMFSPVALCKLALVVFMVQAAMATAADIKLLTGFGLRPVLEEIGPHSSAAPDTNSRSNMAPLSPPSGKSRPESRSMSPSWDRLKSRTI